MAANALKKITTRAKQIYKKGGTWKTAIKKAGAEYRGGRKVGSAKKKRASVKKRPPRKVHTRKRVGAVGDNIATAAIISGLTTSQHMTHARNQLKEQIGWYEAQKFAAPKKSVKNKIAKKIAELKSKYRKLC